MRSRLRLAAAMAACAVVAFACATAAPAATPTLPDDTMPAIATPSPSSSPSAGSCGRQDISVDYGPYYIAGLYDGGTLAFGSADPNQDVAYSTTSVVATVAALEPGVVRTVYGTVEAVTPVDLEVDMLIHGSRSPGQMRVFVEGGIAGCNETRVDAAPRMQVGVRYVLFLAPPLGAGSNVPEWPKIMVAWPVDADDTVYTVEGPMPLADLVARIRRIAPGST
jgi:hypothetical protein